MKVLRLSPTVLRFKPLIKALKIAHGESIVLGVKGERGGKRERNISSVPRDQQAFNINYILDTQPKDAGKEKGTEQFL